MCLFKLLLQFGAVAAVVGKKVWRTEHIFIFCDLLFCSGDAIFHALKLFLLLVGKLFLCRSRGRGRRCPFGTLLRFLLDLLRTFFQIVIVISRGEEGVSVAVESQSQED